MKTKDIIKEMLSLPIEQRAIVADSLLKSLNPPETEIDNKWIAVAKTRLAELRTSKAEGVNGEEVFKKIWKKFSE
jgi:Putative addiction module component